MMLFLAMVSLLGVHGMLFCVLIMISRKGEVTVAKMFTR